MPGGEKERGAQLRQGASTISPNEWRRASSRSSKESGGRRRRVARASAVGEAMTRDKRPGGSAFFAEFLPVISCLRGATLRCHAVVRRRSLPCLLANRNKTRHDFDCSSSILFVTSSIVLADGLYPIRKLSRDFQSLLIENIPFGPICFGSRRDSVQLFRLDDLRQHPLDIFCDDVELDIHDVVRLKACEICLRGACAE